MCRSIRRLRRPVGKPTDTELQEAALQFVRKISGYHHPSEKNRKSFNEAVMGVTAVARQLFRDLGSKPKRKL